MKIFLESIFKDLKRLLTLDLDEVFLTCDIFTLYIIFSFAEKIFKRWVKPISAISVFANADNNSIGKDLAFFIADNCVAQTFH